MQNSRLRSVFPGEGNLQLGYVLKTSGHACVQHYSIVYDCPKPMGKWSNIWVTVSGTYKNTLFILIIPKDKKI